MSSENSKYSVFVADKRANKKMSAASVASNEMSMNAASMVNMGFQPIPGMLSPTPMMGGMMSPPPMLMPTPIQGGMAIAPGQGNLTINLNQAAAYFKIISNEIMIGFLN